MNRRASEDGDRERAGCVRPEIRRDTALRHRNASRRRHRKMQTNEYIYEQMTNQEATTHNGGSVTTEQADEQMPKPVRYNAEKGAGRRCCRKHMSVPRSSASLLENLHRKAMELGRRRTEREASGIGPTTLRPLSAPEPFLLPRPPPFIGQEGAVRY